MEKELGNFGISLGKIIPWGKNTFNPQTPILHIIQNCNSKCVMCDCWKTKEKIYHAKEELENVIIELGGLGASSVMVSGGEPTLHPELNSIIDLIHENGMTVQLNTNGVSLDRHKELTNKHIEALIVSLDGFNPSDYLKVRGRNWFDKVCNNITEFKKNSPNTVIGIRVTLTKYTFNQIEKLEELVRMLQVDSIGFNPMDCTSNSFSREMTHSRIESLVNSL